MDAILIVKLSQDGLVNIISFQFAENLTYVAMVIKIL